MSLPKTDPTKTKAWSGLLEHFEQIKSERMQSWFEADPDRAERMSITLADFYVDYSKNRILDKTLSLLFDLANEAGLKQAIDAQFSGAEINETEGRAVLHTALRDFGNMKPEVKETLAKIKSFSDNVINCSWKGASGKPITDVVNIGIGGSDLGPDMICEALKYYQNHLNVHFISNVDGDHIMESLKTLDRETTLFIIVSKTFTTQETLTNANTVRSWFLETMNEADVKHHFAAVSVLCF